MLKKLLLLLFVSLWITTEINAQYTQPKDTSKTYGPFELLTSYYETNFRPFKKRNWYTGTAFSLEDKSMENTSRLFDKVLTGDKLDYDLTFKGGYFLKDYVMVGLDINYSQYKFTGTVFREPDTLQSNSIKRRTKIYPNITTYFPLTRNERL
ncbi:hypothetical protein DMA11_13030 [Marinilabiliaceae bacterium JC017]|nr:hypothetical protein DMA11_13030 [Marinilabiliaceae bacterium JC017]